MTVPSAEFEYVALRLPRACLRSMWMLTLSSNEWGGQFHPHIKDGKCQLSCNVDLIKGTGLDEHPDAKFYVGNSTAKQQVQIAVTPFYEEVFKVFPMCESDATINMFFHTHPLMMVRDAEVAHISPPSLGDIFAHSVLSNSRNYRQNRQLNTTMVMAFEGLYVYSILPHKFRQIMDRIDVLVNNYTEWTDDEREMWKVGEAPGPVVEKIKMQIFDELRTGNEAFASDVMEFVINNRNLFDIRGAPVIKDSMWNCKGCVVPQLDFPFAKTLGSLPLLQFCRENKLTQTLREHGFNYDFYPAPFEYNDLVILAPVTATMVQRDEP